LRPHIYQLILKVSIDLDRKLIRRLKVSLERLRTKSFDFAWHEDSFEVAALRLKVSVVMTRYDTLVGSKGLGWAALGCADLQLLLGGDGL